MQNLNRIKLIVSITLILLVIIGVIFYYLISFGIINRNDFLPTESLPQDSVALYAYFH